MHNEVYLSDFVKSTGRAFHEPSTSMFQDYYWSNSFVVSFLISTVTFIGSKLIAKSMILNGGQKLELLLPIICFL